MPLRYVQQSISKEYDHEYAGPYRKFDLQKEWTTKGEPCGQEVYATISHS